jgi:hypothetical protein
MLNFFLTETTVGLSQPEQYIQSSLPTRLYSLYKIDSTYTGVTREEKKSEKHTRMRRKMATQQT